MERVSWLLVEELKLFEKKEFEALLSRASFNWEFSPNQDSFYLIVNYFGEPNPEELFKFFNYSSGSCSIVVRLSYLYNTKTFHRLLSNWFKAFAAFKDDGQTKIFLENFTEDYVCFEFPQLIFKTTDVAYEKYFDQHLSNLKAFLEYVFEQKQLFISVAKVDSVVVVPPPEQILEEDVTVKEAPLIAKETEVLGAIQTIDSKVKGIFKLYLLEEIDSYSYRGQSMYKVAFTNFSEHYILLLGRLITPEKKAEYLKILKVEEWFEVEIQLDVKSSTSSKTLSNYDGWLISCASVDYPKGLSLEDNSPKKAFSLNVYTKYSSFDGLFNSDQWSEKAKALGHEVVAFTDFNNVHVFPEAEKSAKKYGLKPLYGSEIEVISDNIKILSNLQLLDPEKPIVFSIFDLETTGLNPLFDEIIEIYIVKYSNGTIIDNYHSYLKCEKELSNEIVNLTNITAEKLDMLGRNKLEVLREVKEYVEGTVLMAHNGLEFDLPFLNAQYKKAEMEPLVAPLLDTLLLAKAIEGEKKSKSYSLLALSKKMSLHIAEKELHSAEYDTHCLVRLWKYWEKQLNELDIDPYSYGGLDSLNDSFDPKKILKNYFGSNVIFFAKNQTGIRDLYELISKAHIDYFVDKPQLHWEAINAKRKNLILISSPTNSVILDALFKDDFALFESEGKKLDYLSLPPPSHFLHEIHRGRYTEEEIKNLLKKFYQWAKSCNFKLIANYCLKFQWYEEIEQYKVLVHAKSIGGKRHPLYSSKFSNEVLPDYSLRTTERFIQEFEFLNLSEEEKEELFFKYREEIVKSISSKIKINLSTLSIPKIDKAYENIQEYIASTLEKKYGPKPNVYLKTTLDRELQGIKENGYETVYWCAHLLVKKSKSEGFLVGSRGSVGSSFLAYVLEISEVNPLPPHYYCSKCSYFELKENTQESGFDLRKKKCPNCYIDLQTDGQCIPFETFLGLERNKVPDIDLNFSGQYQQKAHNFLRELFGREYTFRAGTISAIAEKTAFALAKNYLTDNEIAFNKGKLHWLSYNLTDIKRTTGQHPGGIIVIPKGDSIYRYTPLNYPANDTESEWLTTHFEKDALKDSLFKFDILGQDDPTILALLSKFTNLRLDNISYDDKKILQMFSDISVLEIPESKLEIVGETVGTLGLPEFGTEKTREIVKACKSKINYFADLIRISGISHGKNVWKNNIDRLISNQKFQLSEVITCRDDIMNYLLDKKIGIDKAFRIAESVRNGRGIPEEYLPLLREVNVPEWYIACANKITYIFPKAHATAYVLMCWKIAYFKLYYPVEFYAAYFTITNKHFDIESLVSNDLLEIKRKYQEYKIIVKNKASRENAEKSKYLVMIYEVALEMIARGIKFRMVQLNESLASTFKPDRENRTVLLPFSSILGLGAVTASQLEEERNENGAYKDRADLESRVKLNVNILKLFERLRIITPKYS
ncbi:DNA polymerase III polC-type [Mycoplasma wenyonii str. Massachusetts]|uniref:DNA polymerase III PolC-type n=1 Tax=Mycoplasma wenyonii (strain Massachusetts) TaxID=1197325 RepID=I6ZFF8_MYCWM|nr:PolC-type DNA polymerase III [Mycoplasma wenyonii]AFN65342.1 DNA polymerase III polC-type [Mycoplasma wenyonii str. Massachusetts]